ncbi:MAG: flavin monoamine oxidase family protein [Rhodothalassiaceae bacterium]
MTQTSKAITRRQVLAHLGLAGGSAAMLHGAVGLGLIAGDTASRFEPLPPGRRPTVAILGAGIGGLAAAYELERAGARCVILEASDRLGGRNLTVRRGTVIDELGNRQVCAFDDAPHLYLNVGPARIPGTHHRLLHYCRRLGVRLEPFVQVNYQARLWDPELNGGQAVRLRRVAADARGFLAELAAKQLGTQRLEEPLTPEDLERLQAYVAAFGELAEDGRYSGSDRAGHAAGGMLRPGVLHEPLAFRDLVASDAALIAQLFAESEFQQPSLMQPIGGMDRIIEGFIAALRAPVRTEAVVTDIAQHSDGVHIGYRRRGRTESLRADYCLNSIPGILIQGLRTNFSTDYARAIGRISRGKLSKIGIQFQQRFWEEEGIYGGISWADHDHLQMWYPSHGHHRAKGVVLAGYLFRPQANDRFARLTHAQRMDQALHLGERLHPGRFAALAETGVSVAWQRMNHLLGCAGGVLDDDAALARLQAPDGRHYLIGDQVSRHPGWQEGALASAQAAVLDIARREAAKPA